MSTAPVQTPTPRVNITPATNVARASPASTVPPAMSSANLTATNVRHLITPVPTLSPEKQEPYLLNLIETNSNCELPCFLGIQPKISVWEDIRQIEGPLYSRDSYKPKDGRLLLYAYIKSTSNFEVRFFGSEFKIDYIKVRMWKHLPTDQYGYFPEFAKAIYRYALPNVLKRYGKPSEILLQAHGPIEPGADSLAELFLFYRELGFLAHYYFIGVVYVVRPNETRIGNCS